jgi:hypothetical protein
MDQRAIIEGGRALVLWGATLIDGELRANDEACRKSDADMIALLTPVIKAFLTDKGFECTIQAQQVFGGHGYIEEHGMSQFARDARIAMIYEGANGVQALDLVGRKLPMSGGKPMMGFMQEVIAFVKLITGRYYMKRLLPETGIRLARIQSGAEPVMALEADAF